MTTDIFKSVLAFSEHQLLKKLDSVPKIGNDEVFMLNVSLLKEETKEYQNACIKDDLLGVADAVGDLFYVVMGLVCKHGLQDIFLDKIITPICQSNDSKFCNTREEALKSIQKYGKLDVNTTYTEWNGKYAVHRFKDMKILKGINFQEPKIELS